MQFPSLGWEDPLEEGLETHSSILAWRIPWTEEPSGLLSIGSQRAGHNWSNLACMHACFPGGSDSKESACNLRRLRFHSWVRSEVKWKLLSHVQLFAIPWIVHGILQPRILEWVAILFSRDRTQVSHIAGGFFTNWATREAWKENSNLLQYSFLPGKSLG